MKPLGIEDEYMVHFDVLMYGIHRATRRERETARCLERVERHREHVCFFDGQEMCSPKCEAEHWSEWRHLLARLHELPPFPLP